ncbi:hypothetical protein AAFF_G00064560 [Aldrovandia affinis]|uniref:Uncharacterized protein n=1 Tax=Aldrovandia affinis TaxID=143900 RepID=A0AAD7T3W9_9TELE|nr:hypothetical protein AAFF_G00064560 [Aldrovandia affinis]
MDFPGDNGGPCDRTDCTEMQNVCSSGARLNLLPLLKGLPLPDAMSKEHKPQCPGRLRKPVSPLHSEREIPPFCVCRAEGGNSYEGKPAREWRCFRASVRETEVPLCLGGTGNHSAVPQMGRRPRAPTVFVRPNGHKAVFLPRGRDG